MPIEQVLRSSAFFCFFIIFKFACTVNETVAAQYPTEPCTEKYRKIPLRSLEFDPFQDKTYAEFENRLRSSGYDRTRCLKPWTVLISMKISPDLEKYAIADLLQLENQPQTAPRQMDLIVQIEIEKTGHLRRYHLLPSDQHSAPPLTPRDLENLSFDQLQSPLISETAITSPEDGHKRFGSFIHWATQNYPSDSLMVVFWGHGQGWKTLSELHLRNALAQVQVCRHKPLDVIAWDACYMQSLEDAVEIAPCTRYICGSEDIESYAGYDYTDLIQIITRSVPASVKELKDPAREVAEALPESYQASFNPASGSQRLLDPKISETLTSSSIDSKKLLEILLPALDRLAFQLKEFTQHPEPWHLLKSLIERTSAFPGGTRDLGLFLKELFNELQNFNTGPHAHQAVILTELIQTTCNALNQTVIRRALGTRYTEQESIPQVCQAAGLSIYLPRSNSEFHRQLKQLSQSTLYQKLPFFRSESIWAQWVKSMYPPHQIHRPGLVVTE